MLSVFRHKNSSWLVAAILGLGIIALVITGVGTGPSGTPVAGGGERLAQVGKETVSSVEVADQVNRQLERIRQQQPEVDLAALFQDGAYEEIVKQMIGQKALLAFGREQGMAASKRLVDGEIAGIPAFHNLAGQFDNNVFQQMLAQQRISEQDLRDDIAGSIIQRQLLLPVSAAPVVPQEMALQYASLLLERRSGSIGLIPAAAVAAGPAPTEADIAAFYRKNQARYMIPERRVIRYATFGPEHVGAAAAPTDAEIQAAYQTNAARYAARETRDLSQVVLPDQAAARAFAAKLASGTSFAAAAQQAGFSEADTRLAAQNKAEYQRLTSAAVANAAFAAAEGASTAPVQSPLGWHVVRIDKINRTAATPLAAVRGEIQAQLQQQKAQEALADLVTRMEDTLADGASFEELARAERLQIQETPALTVTGQNPAAADAQTAPEVQALLKEAFQMSTDEDPVVETLAPNRFAVMQLARVVPAAAPPLAQVAERVRGDFLSQRANERARAVAEGIAAKVNRGMPAAQAYAGAGVPVQRQQVSAQRIELAQPNQPVQPSMAMMFSLPKGKARTLAAPNGQGWLVVHLENSIPGSATGQAGLIQATRTQFEQIMGEEYAEQFSRAVQARVKVERDETAIAKVKRSLATNQPLQ